MTPITKCVSIKNELSISTLQTSIYWENKEANLASLEEKIANIPQTDIIVLPEMFNTGFTSNTKAFAEPMNLLTHKWMMQIAARTKAAICGSFLVSENKHFYNRFVFVEPSGKTSVYDKKHLFSLGGEGQNFTAGEEQVTINYLGWRIAPFVCYDLRFPAWCKSINHDLLIFVASWPETRIEAWNTLLKARAIENQVYCVGVNRIGTDGNDLIYNGNSAVYDFTGKCLINAEDKDVVSTVKINKEPLNLFREKLPFIKDSDNFHFT